MQDTAPRSDATHRVCFPFVGESVGGSQIAAAMLIAGLDGTRYEPMVVVHHPGPLGEYLQSLGIEHEVLHLPTFVGAGRTPAAHLAAACRTAPRLVAHLRRQGIAIVHTQDGRMNQTWGLPARLAGARSVWHQHSRYAPSRLTRLAMRLSQRVLCNSEFVRDSLPPEASQRSDIVFNPFRRDPETVNRDLSRQTCLQAVGGDHADLVIAFVGNLTRQKRPDRFLDAAGRIAAQHDGRLRCLVFGRDREQLRPDLERQAEALGLAGRLHFMGFRDPIQLWLAGADLLLSPEVDDGFGRTLVEAMLVGTPVVASDSGGHREIIHDGETGRLVPVDDAAAMAAAALDLLADRDKAQRIAGRARDWADGRFSLAAHVDAVTAIYDRLLTTP